MRTFDFTQDTPAAEWMINHNLKTYPAVDVSVLFNGTQQVVLPLAIEYVDENNILVRFSTARSGAARLAGDYTFKLNE